MFMYRSGCCCCCCCCLGIGKQDFCLLEDQEYENIFCSKLSNFHKANVGFFVCFCLHEKRGKIIDIEEYT